ncbi:Undecaprenyl phosphate-alpha-4-amino-4-deoxy-L-arabinose arabinosyl transferase [Phycisphaerae bacterium RAS1]|nr:Undecaprenyl phosphate-alpha-4-amino-4-deoxy-L-arabinose arabinosyl transferase [Phycisphaerae bacterium RAS1]
MSSIKPAGRAPQLLVALYAAALFLPFLGSGRTLTHHEGMVTVPALRMLEDGAWIVPRYAAGWWLDKPPLANWVTAGVFALSGGFSETAARLPAALSAVGLAVLMATLARRFYGDATGLMAGLVQATCVYALMQGRLGEIDMLFALLIAAAHVVLALQWGRGDLKLSLAAGVAFHTLAGLAVLTKGLVAVPLLGATIIAFAIIRRSFKPVAAVFLTPGIVSFLAVTIAWHVGAYAVAGDEAIEQWRYNYLERFGGKFHLVSEPWFTYFTSIPWLMAPWTVALLIGAKWLWRDARRPDAQLEKFLWCWFLGGLVFLSLSAFKHKHYCLPILPPLAILTAKVVQVHLQRVPVHAPRFYAIVFAVIVIAFAVVNAFVMPKRDPRRPLVDFVRTQTSRLPAEAKLLVVGLGQHAAYPYIQHACRYVDDPPQVKAIVNDPAQQPLYVLTLAAHLDTAEKEGLAFEVVATEPESKKTPPPKRLVLVKPRATSD